MLNTYTTINIWKFLNHIFSRDMKMSSIPEILIFLIVILFPFKKLLWEYFDGGLNFSCYKENLKIFSGILFIDFNDFSQNRAEFLREKSIA